MSGSGAYPPSAPQVAYVIKSQESKRPAIRRGPRAGLLRIIQASTITVILVAAIMTMAGCASIGSSQTATGPQSPGNTPAASQSAPTITELPLPTTNEPLFITAGPDGNLWFTETSAQIGRNHHRTRWRPLVF